MHPPLAQPAGIRMLAHAATIEAVGITERAPRHSIDEMNPTGHESSPWNHVSDERFGGHRAVGETVRAPAVHQQGATVTPPILIGERFDRNGHNARIKQAT